MRFAPHVRPPPMASSKTTCPCRMRPSATAASRASGIDAADVFAWRSTVSTTLSLDSPSLRPVPSMMRLLAWWGTSQSIASGARPATRSRRTRRWQGIPTLHPVARRHCQRPQGHQPRHHQQQRDEQQRALGGRTHRAGAIEHVLQPARLVQAEAVAVQLEETEAGPQRGPLQPQRQRRI